MSNFFSQIQVSKLVDRDYVFASNPPSQGLYQYLTLFFGLMVIVAAMLFLLNYRVYKKGKTAPKIRQKLAVLLLTIGSIGLLIVFFRFEAIAYLSSRLMFWFLFLAAVGWLFTIFWYQFIILPKEIKTEKQKEKFNKYLPQHKTSNERKK